MAFEGDGAGPVGLLGRLGVVALIERIAPVGEQLARRPHPLACLDDRDAGEVAKAISRAFPCRV